MDTREFKPQPAYDLEMKTKQELDDAEKKAKEEFEEVIEDLKAWFLKHVKKDD